MRNPRVVVVTGASGGLGRAIAHEFAKQGAKIGLIARGIEGLKGAKQEVEELGGEALILPLDVADPKAVFSAAEEVERHFGPIDIWVNNAMASVFSPVIEMKPEEYKRVTEVTYLGYVHGTLAALGSMIKRNSGHIIQVGSALSWRSIPLQSAYCGAKHAVMGFTESLRTELMHDKSDVTVSIVQMPALNTPQFRWVLSRLRGLPQPVPPIFQPEVGARAVAWIADHPRKEVLLGGSTVQAVWGEKLVPRIADWYLAQYGYESQQIPGTKDPHDRPVNLWRPVPYDAGTHGVFDERSKPVSWQWEFTHHLLPKMLTVVGTMALGLFAYRSLNRRPVLTTGELGGRDETDWQKTVGDRGGVYSEDQPRA